MTKILGRKCDRCGYVTLNYRQIEAVENPGKEEEEFTILGDLCSFCLHQLKRWMDSDDSDDSDNGD